MVNAVLKSSNCFDIIIILNNFQFCLQFLIVTFLVLNNSANLWRESVANVLEWCSLKGQSEWIILHLAFSDGFFYIYVDGPLKLIVSHANKMECLTS